MQCKFNRIWKQVLVTPASLCAFYYLGQAMRTCLMSYRNNKGVDQPAQMRSLNSTFAVRWLDSMYTSYSYVY